MFTDTYRTISNISEGIYKDKGSKFLSFAIPVQNEAGIKHHLQELRKKYHDARHHCYAWALGPTRDAFRSNDDGEPSGTAGKPIYGQILSNDVTNILIVVVRYFGGVKLGVRGLINAYKAAANEAIGNNSIIEKVIREVYEVHFEYQQINDVMKVLKDYDLEQMSHDFGVSCSIMIAVRRDDAEKVKNIFSSMYPVSIKFKHTL
jgi:uncharacterized YigZ family protein